MILILSSDHIPHVGGKSTHILDLMAGISDAGEQVSLYSQSQFSRLEQIAIKLVISPVKIFDAARFQYCYKQIWRRILARKALSIYRRYKPQCISCQDAFAAAALKAVRDEIKCPVVLTMHTYFGLENALDKKKTRVNTDIYNKNLDFELQSLEVVDKIIAVDDRILEHVRSTIRKEINNRNIRVKDCLSIVNFTNTDFYFPVASTEKKRLRQEYGIPDDAFIIVCARRLVEKNGVIYAVEAMKSLDDQTMMIIAGDGPQQSAIKEYIENQGLGTRVDMVGSVLPDKMIDYYRMSDCSVVPSITVNGLQEATSISALEAMSTGLPTVASRIGGLSQIITDGVTGFLVDEKAPDQIANAVKKLYDNEIRVEMGRCAREYVVNNHSHLQGAKKYLVQFS